MVIVWRSQASTIMYVSPSYSSYLSRGIVSDSQTLEYYCIKNKKPCLEDGCCWWWEGLRLAWLACEWLRDSPQLSNWGAPPRHLALRFDNQSSVCFISRESPRSITCHQKIVLLPLLPCMFLRVFGLLRKSFHDLIQLFCMWFSGIRMMQGTQCLNKLSPSHRIHVVGKAKFSSTRSGALHHRECRRDAWR